MIRPIAHSNYHKLTDELMWLSNCVILKMNVNLYTTNKNYKNNYHKEFKTGDKITLKRTFDAYISLESTSKADVKEFIPIGPGELYLLNDALDKVLLWFNDKKYQNLFSLNNNVLTVTQTVTPVTVNQLPMSKIIAFEPIVCYNAEYNTQNPGVRIYIGSEAFFIDINVSRLVTLKMILSQANIYLYAQNMLNYLGRPEYGTNMFEFDNELPEDSEPTVECKSGRMVNKSFFDKMG